MGSVSRAGANPRRRPSRRSQSRRRRPRSRTKRPEYREQGNHLPETVTDHFGGWVDALETAGLDPDTRVMGEGLHVSCPRCECENRYSGDVTEWTGSQSSDATDDESRA